LVTGQSYFEDKTHVKAGDAITKDRAVSLLEGQVKIKAEAVNSYVRSKINQNQFDALVSFAYNCGTGALKTSTLLKRVNANPNDLAGIKAAFLLWDKIHKDGQLVESPGLKERRLDEYKLYATPI
jgi:lysozyme